jgi:hypothetical protein
VGDRRVAWQHERRQPFPVGVRVLPFVDRQQRDAPRLAEERQALESDLDEQAGVDVLPRGAGQRRRVRVR